VLLPERRAGRAFESSGEALTSGTFRPNTRVMAGELTTCVVADDHPAILLTICGYLERGGVQVVGRARSGDEAVALIEAQQPTIAVVDAHMPGLSGTAAIRRLTRSTPQCATILYTAHDDPALLIEALDAGARGYVLKDAPLETLARIVETVAAGGTYIDPSLAHVVIERMPDGRSSLTRRERDVLRMLADGHTNESIGKALFISPDTARTQLATAMAKLGASTRTQAVALALRQDLIS